MGRVKQEELMWWRPAVVARFGEREELSWEALVHNAWGYFDATAVTELLNELEAEFLVPAGILRPEDPLEWLLAPEPASNWFMRLGNEADAGAAENCLFDALEARLPREERERLHHALRSLHTLGELAWIWCNRRVPSEWGA